MKKMTRGENAHRQHLQRVVDVEQGREACKAITLDNEPVFFNDQRYFAGEDTAELLRTMARRFG